MVDVSGLHTAILQLGYDKNRAGYKFTEIEDAFPQFKIAQQIWAEETNGNTPGFTQRDSYRPLTCEARAAEPSESVKVEPAGEAISDNGKRKKAAR